MIKKGLLYSIPFLAALYGLSVYGYIMIPEGTQVPSHFDTEGNVNSTIDRNVLLVLFPAIATFLVGIFVLLPIIDPRRQNFAASQGLYFAGWFGALSIQLMVHAMIIISAVHDLKPDVRWALTGSALLLIVIGNFMAKSRSTWFLGLRTPWTLSSEHAWTVANRLTGWLMVLTGIVTLGLAAFREPQSAIVVMTGGAVASALIGVVVSYFAWRSDPDRGAA